MTKTMGLLREGEEVTLDFDHQFIPAHKFDAKYSYKKDFGYFPGWASIGGLLVGCENRDGNANVRFRQADTLVRIMDRVKQVLGVTICSKLNDIINGHGMSRLWDVLYSRIPTNSTTRFQYAN